MYKKVAEKALQILVTSAVTTGCAAIITQSARTVVNDVGDLVLTLRMLKQQREKRRLEAAEEFEEAKEAAKAAKKARRLKSQPQADTLKARRKAEPVEEVNA